jgi:F-box-like
MYASAPEHGVAMLSLPQTPSAKCLGAGSPATIPRLRSLVSSHDRLLTDDCTLVSPPKLDAPLDQSTADVATASNYGTNKTGKKMSLLDLPEEIQQRILDMMMGELQPSSTSVSETNGVLRNWNSVMRHPRSPRLTDLSLVCESWRRLIQSRIYRHGMSAIFAK